MNLPTVSNEMIMVFLAVLTGVVSSYSQYRQIKRLDREQSASAKKNDLDVLRELLAQMRQELSEVKAELAEVKTENLRLHDENIVLTKRVSQLEAILIAHGIPVPPTMPVDYNARDLAAPEKQPIIKIARVGKGRAGQSDTDTTPGGVP